MSAQPLEVFVEIVDVHVHVDETVLDEQDLEQMVMDLASRGTIGWDAANCEVWRPYAIDDSEDVWMTGPA